MNLNIMLIDDNKIDLFVNQKIIELLAINSKVTTFDSGTSAIDFFKILEGQSNFKSVLFPDIILLDINMPEMDGFQFLSEFKKLKGFKNKHTRIYILSSSTNIEDVKKAKKKKSCIGFISKPLTTESLKKILPNCKPYLHEYDYLEEGADIIKNIPNSN